ncbi:MAG: hypothetical protein EPN31_00820 [Castellaniella sp.]|uniref:hypothetical protein n=1 Tax=Castellaniella sp. TaxID=1955812 RepID=UPI0012238116|nr:hypothetical protein [Castellaniella sp.]TAN31149.1 MAG: hypothetical protein EPN31_00820 [Castellaniella sp.]
MFSLREGVVNVVDWNFPVLDLPVEVFEPQVYAAWDASMWGRKRHLSRMGGLSFRKIPLDVIVTWVEESFNDPGARPGMMAGVAYSRLSPHAIDDLYEQSDIVHIMPRLRRVRQVGDAYSRMTGGTMVPEPAFNPEGIRRVNAASSPFNMGRAIGRMVVDAEIASMRRQR